MLVKGPFEKAREYIETHSRQQSGRFLDIYPCITISRETGAGADIVGSNILEFFTKHVIPGSPGWTVFDKNIISKVLDDHHLPLHLQRFLEEDKYSVVTSLMTELLTGEPSAWTLVNKEIQTILQLGRTGNVVIIGRGGNFITARLKNVFHVRLVAPFELRVKRIQELFNISKKEAEIYVNKDDAARRNFVFAHFHQKVENPLHYHIIINTGNVSHSDAARLIGRAVLKKFKSLYNKKPLQEQFH